MGGISYLVDVGLSNLLVYGLFGFPAVLHDSPLKAKIISTIASIIVAWLGNKFLTYEDRSSGSNVRGFVMFVVVNLIGMLVVLAPLGVTWYLLGLHDRLSYNLSTNVIGIALGMVFRFYAYRTWVFRDAPQKEVVVTDVADDLAGRGEPVGAAFARVSARRGAWRWFLALVWTALATALTVVYWPGRANNDIAYQALQAQGRIPFTDWHPPIMSALWQLLLGFTGQLGTLLALQVGLYCLAGWLLCVLVLRRTGSRVASLLPLAGLLAPWSLSQLGILWKDTQMAVAFLVAAGLIFLILPRAPRTLWLLVPVAVLLVYGTGVRKNAVAAVLALACAIAWQLARCVARARGARRLPRPRLVGAAAVAGVLALLLGTTAAVGAAVDAAHRVQRTGQSSQIMLDDVLFSVPREELAAAGLPPEFVAHAQRARTQCEAMGERWDAYWNCWGRGESGAMYSPLSDSDQRAIAQAWRGHVLPHPLRYCAYRAHVFDYYLFTSRLEYWPSGKTKDADAAGLHAALPGAEHGIEAYVQATAGTLGFFFKPWFWAVAGIGALVMTARRRGFRFEVWVLSCSALCYIAAYFFIAPANHFRYTYWPALAITAAWMLLASGPTTRLVRRSREGERGVREGRVASGTVSGSAAD